MRSWTKKALLSLTVDAAAGLTNFTQRANARIYRRQVPDQVAELGHEESHSLGRCDDVIVSARPLLHVHVQRVRRHLQNQCVHVTQPSRGHTKSPSQFSS